MTITEDGRHRSEIAFASFSEWTLRRAHIIIPMWDAVATTLSLDISINPLAQAFLALRPTRSSLTSTEEKSIPVVGRSIATEVVAVLASHRSIRSPGNENS